MTIWLPKIHKNGNPIYVEIADAIENDIIAGILSAGDKLPPVRNVAFDIKVTVGTVSRAYALACERGLISGEVGRGTYVLDKSERSVETLYIPPESRSLPDTQSNEHPSFHLGYASAANVGQSELIAEMSAGIANGHPTKIMDYVRNTPSQWKEAGKKWLSHAGWSPDIKDIVPTNGALAAGIAAIATITLPGDKIAMEGLTYCSIARSAALLGRRIITTEFDEDGIIPESFERLCAQQHPKVLFLMPTIQNPTLAHLSEDRRIAIADIAHRYNVWIIEDAIYAPLAEDKTPPMAHFAPDRTFHVGGLSKTVSAGIRSGWAACPPRFADRISNAHKMLTGGGAYWLTELATQLVLDGTADKICQLVQKENNLRHDIVTEILGDLNFKSHPFCPYIWIKLPEPWHSGTFKNALMRQNIIISDEDDFKPTRTNEVYHGVRVGVSSIKNTSDLAMPFKIIRNLLESGVAGYEYGASL